MYNKKIDKFQGQVEMVLKESLADIDLTCTQLFKTLRIKSHLTGAGIRKLEGYSACHLLFALFTLVFLPLKGVSSCARLNLTTITAAGKDAFYRLKNRDLSWRSFLWRLLGCLSQRLAWSHHAPEDCYFVLDTTVLPKRGEKIEEVSYVYDHCRGRTVLGYELSTLLLVNPRGYYPLDFGYLFSKHRGKDHQAATVAHPHSSLDRRRQEALINKLDCSLRMLERALAKGIKATYALMDRWFASPKFFLALRQLGLHGIGRLKRGTGRYQYQGHWYTLDELYQKAKTSLVRYRALGYSLTRLEVVCANGLHGSIVFSKGYQEPEVNQLAGAKLPPQPKWAAFFTTDVSLAVDEVVKKYLCRWSMEVFFKEAKTLLGLGKDQSRSFAAQVGATTLTLLRFNVLAFVKAQQDAAQTSGGLFRELAEEIGLLTLQEKIIAYFRKFLLLTLELISQSLAPQDNFQDFIDIINNIFNKIGSLSGCES